MAGQSPQDIAARWASGMSGSTQKIQAGIQAVTVAPGQAAARQKAVWAQNTMAAQDKWAARTAAVTLADWQQAMLNKGVQRIGAGAQAAQPKFAEFMTQLLPFIEQGRAQLPARGNLDQNIARSAAWIRHMSTFQRARTR